MMLPAPRNPTPVTTPGWIRVGPPLPPPKSRDAWMVSRQNSVEPMHTSVCVRRPAALRPTCRSQPTTVPRAVETSMAITSCIGPPAPGSAALEARRALLEERLQSLVHVLARGQDSEQAALQPLPVGEP